MDCIPTSPGHRSTGGLGGAGAALQSVRPALGSPGCRSTALAQTEGETPRAYLLPIVETGRILCHMKPTGRTRRATKAASFNGSVSKRMAIQSLCFHLPPAAILSDTLLTRSATWAFT